MRNHTLAILACCLLTQFTTAASPPSPTPTLERTGASKSSAVPAQAPAAVASNESRTTAPMKTTSSGLMEKDHADLRLRWAKMRLVAEAEGRWRGQPWENDARAVTRDGLEIWINQARVRNKVTPQMTARARALLDAGCQEPLACFMSQIMLFEEKHDWRAAQAASNLAYRSTGKKNIPAPLRTWIVSYYLDWLGHQTHARISSNDADRLLSIMGEAIIDPGYAGELEPVLVRDLGVWLKATSDFKREALDKLRDTIIASPRSEWAKQTMLARLEIEYAWKIRGRDWASEVSEDSFKGFAEHLALASAHARKAHDLRTDRPESAAEMITILNGQEATKEEIRGWFDLSTQAQFDYLPAYRSLLNACSEKWGGSQGLVLMLGRRFAETGRYDTEVPDLVFDACLMITTEVANARAVFSHPLVKDAIVTYARSKGQSKSGDQQENSNFAAVAAWLTGEDRMAAEMLKTTGWEISPSAKQRLNGLLTHADAMRNSVSAGSGLWGERMQAVEKAFRSRNYQQTLDAIKALRPEDLKDEKSRNYAFEMRDILEFPQRMKDGAWHRLPIYPGLSTCLVMGGDWSASPAGEISLTGSDNPRDELVFSVVTREKFELRGEFSVDAPPTNDWLRSWALCPMTHWQPSRSGNVAAYGLRGVVFYPKSSEPKAAIAGQFYTRRQAEQPAVLAKDNRFRISVEGDIAEFELNGVIFARTTGALEVETQRGLVGISCTFLPKDAKLTLRNIEVRAKK
jgi:hypothetical protein